MKINKFLVIGLGSALLIAATAGASAFVTNKMNTDEKPVVTQAKAPVTKTQTKVVYREAAPVKPACDDDNIVGKVVGGVGGGLIGSQIGKGNGKTAAIIGGSVGGTLLGEEYLPTRNVTCPK